MKKTFVLLVCAVLCIIIFACRAPIMEGTTSLSTITMTLPQTFFTNSATDASKRAIISCSDGTITLDVTASNMSTVTSTFTLSENSYTASVKIPKGKSRTFTVRAKDKWNTIYAQGSTTVDIFDTTESIDLTLKPVASVNPNITLTEECPTSFYFMSSDEESEDTEITEDKVYVFPFTFNFNPENKSDFNFDDLGELSLNVVNSESENATSIATGTNSWTPASEEDIYYILLTKSDTTYYFCVTKKDGTELVNWIDQASESNDEEGFYKESYNLEITDKDDELIGFSIQSTTSLEIYIAISISDTTDDTSPTISGSGTEDDPYSVTIGNTLTLTSDTEYTSYQWYLGDDTDLGTEQSATVATDDLSSGVYQVTLLTTDATESEHESSVYIQIEEASTISVTIVTPDDTSPTISGSGTEDDPYSVTIGNTLTLTSDTEYTSYQWYLGNDTDLGTKQSATVATDDLSSGVYLVTLLATDTDDTEYEDSVYITVEEEN